MWTLKLGVVPVTQFLNETDVFLKSLRFEDRMTLRAHAIGGNMVQHIHIGIVQYAVGALIAGRP
jgi:hypothetical protein